MPPRSLQQENDHAAPTDIRLFHGPFYFLRHGQTETNVQDRIAGWDDTALTELGRRQAQSAAELLVGHAITGIYSSALKRARYSAMRRRAVGPTGHGHGRAG